MPANKIAPLAIVCGLAVCAAASPGNAAEYAFTTYPLGSFAFDAGVTPPPGVLCHQRCFLLQRLYWGKFRFWRPRIQCRG